MGRETWRTIDESWQVYVQSGIWKCNKSPTGAHHFIRMDQTDKLASGEYYLCKYCLDVRSYPMSIGYMKRLAREKLT